MCGFLCLSSTSLRHHLIDDHEETGLDSEEATTSNAAWLPTALRAGIQLTCPVCPNTFNSGRSFKVHLNEDHGWDEMHADAEFDRRNDERREKASEVMAEERRRAREERRKRKQAGFEAYVDANNELRIRVPKGCDLDIRSDNPENNEINSEEEIDVTREEGDISAAQYLALVAATKGSNSKSSEGSWVGKRGGRRSRTGRPRGSRSTGISAVRRAAGGSADNLQLSDEMMGEECGVGGCALRLKEEEQISLHRRSHADDGTFVCPLCTEPAPTWSVASIHLWRAHSLDLGLLKCSSCNYRTHSKAKLARHQTSHSDHRPWLCPLCGQAFKLSKQLRAHSMSHREEGISGDRSVLSCNQCQAKFTLVRHLKHHIETVHNKVKKFLCSFCGYAASSRSALQLHVRKHTGDKPFQCGECSYSTADHNSLRRHKMRHSGVRPYRCPYCPYTSIQSTTYKVHLKTKHAVEDMSSILFQCGVCAFRTVKESIFLTHVAGHNEEQDKDKEAKEPNEWQSGEVKEATAKSEPED